jgi:hypothetical protein
MTRRPVRHLLIAACCALPIGALAGLVPPDDPEPVTDAYNIGYQDGFIDGTAEGRQQCFDDPASCSIYPSNVLPPAQYGETEPNDTLISADFLEQAINFWGQSSNPDDQDWFYVVTPDQNYNINLTFSLPNARSTNCTQVLDSASETIVLQCNLTGWTISIMNALGMVITEFETGFTSVEYAQAGINYRATLGLAGTYYVRVQPSAESFSYQEYNLTAVLQDSPSDAENFPGGTNDAEMEPNNTPRQATPISTGVPMFGMVNLRFDAAMCNAEECTYLQDEPDWFMYESPGNEILQISFCDRTSCPPGDWLVQIFDSTTARAIDSGTIDTDDATPLMSFNTDTMSTGDAYPIVWQAGLNHPGKYLMRIGLKRTFEAPCIEWTTDIDNDGIPDGDRGNCSCSDGTPICELDILNPGEPVIKTITQVIYPVCPNGTGGGENAYCNTSCVCINQNCTLYQTDDDGDGLPGPNPVPCRCQPEGTSLNCTITTPNPGTPTVLEVPLQESYPLCADGSGGGGSPQCTVGCMCTDTTGVVEIPENNVSAPYNLTLSSSLFGTPRQ